MMGGMDPSYSEMSSLHPHHLLLCQATTRAVSGPHKRAATAPTPSSDAATEVAPRRATCDPESTRADYEPRCAGESPETP